MTAAEKRARDGWIALALAAALLWGFALSLALAGCDKTKHPREAAFATGAEDCALQLASAGANDLVDQAIASAQGSPGAPSWGTFSMGELITRGIPLAICVAEKAISAIDMKIPPAPSDASGNVIASKLQLPQTEARGFMSAPVGQVVSVQVAASLTAHAHLVDFLNAHGVVHEHKETR